MLLATATPKRIKRGYYFVQYDIPTGALAVSISTEGLTATPLTELTKSASGYTFLALPECTLTATLTGTAKVSVSPVALDD